jgi:hypothetical protein
MALILARNKDKKQKAKNHNSKPLVQKLQQLKGRVKSTHQHLHS